MLEEKYLALQGGIRPWWDVAEQRMIQAAVLYMPQGCPDWGERGGKRNDLCTFCSLPYAASGYRSQFFNGRMPTVDEQLDLFKKNFEALAPAESDIHTVMVFNAGSFLATLANPPDLQQKMTGVVAKHPNIKRFVFESRAELITEAALGPIVNTLKKSGKELTIRVGIETQDDNLRVKVLKKGHSRLQLLGATAVMRKLGVTSGGYVLLNPAPGLDPIWAIRECEKTIDWVLGTGPDQLNMNESYFCSTNVGPGTPLEAAWQAGEFKPATLWMVYAVLRMALSQHAGRLHLLPFKDEPELLAVPSNHVPAGIPQSLKLATGCDREFHQILDRYRETMEASALTPPACHCLPSWA